MKVTPVAATAAIAFGTLALGGCATSSQQLAWGKPGVSRVDYGTDIGMCTGLAVVQTTANQSNSAGGIEGRNAEVSKNSEGASGSQVGPPSANAGVSAPIPAGGAYAGMTSADFAQRAANQQQAREMAGKRAKAELFRTCLVERGYREFALTPEQKGELSRHRKGSGAHVEYLYTLGSDPSVVEKQALRR
jgi:hypothetical protein